MNKDNLVYLLGGVILGIIAGVLIANFSSGPRQVAAPVTSPAPMQQTGPMEQQGAPAAQQNGQNQPLPEGHPPVDDSSLKQQIAKYQDVIAKDPTNQEAIVNLANLNFDLKNYPEATKWYDKAIQKDSKNVDLITDLGSCYLWQNDYGKALEYYNKSLTINPNHFQTLMNIGIARMATGDKEGAAEAWQKLVTLYPENPDAQMLKDAIKKLQSEKKQS